MSEISPSNNKNKQDTTKIADEPLDMIDESRRKAYLWLFMGVLFFVVSISLAFFAYRIIKNKELGKLDSFKSLSVPFGAEKPAIDTSKLRRRMIDGSFVEEGQDNVYPFALMIDNHPDARPQAGLSQANLVYEAEAEGSVTRYMAVFASGENIEKIGPVRSARPYFVDWARELSALYGHVGGSPDALVYMQKENVLHINEFYDGEYFWRDESRSRPHNVFTSAENLGKYLAKKELKEGAFLGWQFKDEEVKEKRGTSSIISIPYKLIEGKVEWRYDREANEYSRYLAGTLHQDGDRVIKAKNIIIQVVKATVLDESLRLKMDSIGKGKAVLCLDGYCREAQWQKNSATARTRFYDETGTELKLNAGTTWVEVVQPEIEFKY
jgi:hypothetical protein